MQFLLWAISIILSAIAGYWVYRADKKRDIPYPWLTATLRGIVVLLTLLLLLAPAITLTRNKTEKPLILLLQDNSSSIANALGKDTSAYIKNAQQLAEKLFDKYKVITWGFGNTIQTDSAFSFRQPATDISTALSRVQEYYGNQNLGAVILATDGRYNQGSNPLFQQLSIQSPLYTVGIGDSTAQKDLRITQVYHNKTATLNSQFEIRADIVATLCAGYNNGIQLLENGQNVSSSNINISTDRYDRSVSFTIKATKAGLHHYIILAPVTDGEQNTANNRKDVFVEVVDEKKNILIVAAAPHPDINAIAAALNEVESYKVTVRMANDLPPLNDYKVIIAHQLPSLFNNIQSQLTAAHKPVWYIMGGQTNAAALMAADKSLSLNININAPRDEYSVYEPAFSAFTIPQNLQAVLDKMPPLSVPSGQIQYVGNADVLFKQRDGAQAVWMLQQGTVPTALLTGTGLWRWRLYEYKNFNTHNTIDECIRQTVAFLAANSNEKPFYVSLPKYVWSDQEVISLNAYLLNANNEQVNTAEVQLTIADSAGKKQSFSFEHSGNAYKLNTGIWPNGTYSYSARTSYNGTTLTAGGSFVVEHTPLEQMESGADYKMLYSLSRKYSGSFVPAANILSLYDSISKNTNIKPVIQSDVTTQPLVEWRWYFLLILAFAVAEWLLRKYWLAQ